MSNVFVGLFFVACIGFIIGLTKPHKFKKVFKGNSNRKVVGTTLGIVVVFLIVMIGVVSPALHKGVTPTSTLRTVSSTKAPNPVITTKIITTTQPIAFTSTTEQDASLANGTTAIKVAGVNGVESQKWQVTYSNGAEEGRNLISTTTTTQPVTEVIEQGTYVAPKPIPTPVPIPTPTPPRGCYPLTDAANCYEPGEYCRDSDHGVSGVAGDGKQITCMDNDGWRWEP